MSSDDRLSPFDAAFLSLEEEGVPMHVAVVLVFDARPLTRPDAGLDFELIERFIGAQLDGVPRYRQRLAYVPLERHPIWIDDETFNLHYHVRHTRLPRPGNERLLKRLAGRLMSEKLDRDKPLWEIWVVEGLDGNRFALILKAHQAMVGGIGGIDLLTSLLRATPDASIREQGPWTPRPAPPATDLLADAVRQRARLAGSLLRGLRESVERPDAARDAVSAVWQALATGLRPADSTPLNPPHIGPHRRLDWVRTDLEATEEAARRAGGRVTDAVLAALAGAMGEFLRRRGVRVDGLDFRALVPVDGRAREGGAGTRTSLEVAPLPVDEHDAARRLERVVEETRGFADSREARGQEVLQDLSGWASGTGVGRLLTLATRIGPYNLVVSYVPGPRETLYLLGARLLEVVPVLPLLANQALSVALFAYDGSLYWGLDSDWDRVPDLHDFAEALARSADELRAG